MRSVFRVLILVAAVSMWADRAAAQGRPAPIVEAVAGYAGFVDESMDGRGMFGGGARFFVTPRIALGPEFVFLRGSAGEYDWTFTANVNIDLVRDESSSPRRAVPYIAIGGGYVHQVRQVGGGPGSTELVPFGSGEGTISGGIGVRIALGKRWFIAPEARFGWEPEVRVGVTIGIRPGRK